MTDTNQLKDYGLTLMVDQSASMLNTDVPKGTRWSYSEEAAFGLANKLHTLSPEGFTLMPFSNHWKKYENVTPAKVTQIFQENEPNGGTNLAGVLKAGLDDYFTRKAAGKAKKNGEIFAVITDGEPDDKEEVARVIVAATKKIDRDEELGISFIQVGQCKGASTFLKRLDDHLKAEGAKFDIVNTITLEDMGDKSLTDVLIAALDE